MIKLVTRLFDLTEAFKYFMNQIFSNTNLEEKNVLVIEKQVNKNKFLLFKIFILLLHYDNGFKIPDKH